jgi:uncharacterized membrane protein
MRFWEIDLLRGIAIIMMIASNLITDLQYFANYPSSPFWWAFARTTAFIFIFLVGLSLTISYARVKDSLSARKLHFKYIKRGLYIFGLGLIITLATFIFIRTDFIIFGVLHLIGISIILAYPFLKIKKYWSLVFGLLFILAGALIKNLEVSSLWLLWTGLVPAGFRSIDYFPLLPWFGVVLLGLFFGKILYPSGKSMVSLACPKPANPLCFIGRHSLIIYFIHQPILLSFLFLTIL